MVITENPTATLNLINRIAKLMEGTRAPGTHVYDLVSCLRKAKARQQGLFPAQAPHETMLFAVGRSIQDYITGQNAEDSEVALELDGIHGTIDMVDENGEPWEIKGTYVSAARDIKGTAHYFDQLATYMYMRTKITGHLAVVYINGYYDGMRKSRRPGAIDGERAVLKVWDIVSTTEELNEWWNQLTARRALFSSAQDYSGLPLEYHYTWECGYCPLKDNGCPGGPGSYYNRWVGGGAVEPE